MKKTVLLFVLLLLLTGCSHEPAKTPDAPITPDIPNADTQLPDAPAPDDTNEPSNKTTVSVLPSGSGINWNDVINAGGNAKKSSSYTVPVFLKHMYLPSESKDLSPDEEHLLSVYAPFFSCFKDKQAEEKLNTFIVSLVNGYLEKTEKLYAESKSGELNTRPFGWCGVSAELAGGYINLSFEYMYSCETYTLDENGNEIYMGNIDSFYSTDVYCLDPVTMDVLTIEDIFYSDCDLGTILGRCIAQALDSENIELKRPFRGLPANWTSFCIQGNQLIIKFPSSNPYEQHGVTLSIPLWKLRSCIYLRDEDLSLLDLGNLSQDERPTVSLCAFENSDFSVEVYDDSGERMLRLIQHTPGEYAVDKINTELKNMHLYLVSLRPDGEQFDYPPAINKECYILANLVTVSYSMSYMSNNQWQHIQYCAVFDLTTGDKLKVGDAVTINQEFRESNSYVSTPIPDDLHSGTNLFLNPYGSAIVCWNDGKTSAWAASNVIKTEIWRDIP